MLNLQMHGVLLVACVLCGALAAQDGSLDTTFDPGTGPNGGVFALALQPDGKILLGGAFIDVGGAIQDGYMIARMNANGSPDPGFHPLGGASQHVRALALQPDGKIMIGGLFDVVDALVRGRVARMETDGDADPTFDADISQGTEVNALSIQADGKILIGGSFQVVGGVVRTNIARLDAAGGVDTAFAPSTDGIVYGVALQPDGKVLICGNFTTVSGAGRERIARLNANGTLDTTFNPGNGANMRVDELSLQPDGKILIGGIFTLFGGVARNRVARLNTDGSLDTTFEPDVDGSVTAFHVQANGKVVIGGNFAMVDGVARNNVARLNADGSLDTTFDPGTGANQSVEAMVVQPDGKLLIAGLFTQIDGTPAPRIARLNISTTVGGNGDGGDDDGDDDDGCAVGFARNGHAVAALFGILAAMLLVMRATRRRAAMHARRG